MRYIAEYEYQNGRFGTNVAAIARVAGGYSVGNGGLDPMFYRSPVEAKAAFRAIVADNPDRGHWFPFGMPRHAARAA